MNEYQAKSGFKTFVITLILSLVIFGALYYILTDSASSEVDIESDVATETQNENYSAFGRLSTESMDVQGSAVLAGADGAEEATEATTVVPDTGSNTTAGTIVAISALTLGIFILLNNPRRFAIANFEKKFLRDLD